MGLRIVRWEPTPNPSAMKAVIEAGAGGRPRSYLSASQAAEDPIASGLFAIEGVANVLIHESFITVGKAPGAAWGPIRRRATAVIEGGP